MAVMCKANVYTKLEKEDPEERKHREAQFLIYKTLEQADKITVVKRCSRPYWVRLRMRSLKLKVGKKLKKMRNTIVLICGYRSFVGSHLKSLRRLILGGSSATSDKARLHGMLDTSS